MQEYPQAQSSEECFSRVLGDADGRRAGELIDGLTEIVREADPEPSLVICMSVAGPDGHTEDGIQLEGDSLSLAGLCGWLMAEVLDGLDPQEARDAAEVFAASFTSETDGRVARTLARRVRNLSGRVQEAV